MRHIPVDRSLVKNRLDKLPVNKVIYLNLIKIMFESNKKEITECTRCRNEFDARQKVCPQCNFEISAKGGKFRLPLILYPIMIMFGIYLGWLLFSRYFSSP